jgi:hypothetical protein
MNTVAALIRSTSSIYKKCLLSAAKALFTNTALLAGVFALAFITVIIYQIILFLPLEILKGFVLGLYQIAALTVMYGWLSDIVQGSKISFRGLISFQGDLFFKIMSVGFFLWIADLVIQSFLPGASGREWLLIYGFLIGIIFNPIPEVVYIHRFDGAHAFSHSLNFIKENWVEWFIPVLIFIAFCRVFYPMSWLSTFVNAAVLLPVAPMISPLLSIGFVGLTAGLLVPFLFGVFGLALGSFFMIFRGMLFKELDTSSRRKRAYQYR